MKRNSAEKQATRANKAIRSFAPRHLRLESISTRHALAPASQGQEGRWPWEGQRATRAIGGMGDPELAAQQPAR
eukprot:10255706-Alexandrium_andersonii.AAC.1